MIITMDDILNEDVERSSGIFVVNKNALTEEIDSATYTPQEFPDDSNLLCHWPAESDKLLFIDLDKANLRKLKSNIYDVRSLQYEISKVLLPNEVNPEEDVILFSLNY